MSSSVFAGVDISKDSLHVHLAQHLHDNSGPFRVFSFDHQGLPALLDWLDAHHVHHVAFEASGGYERPLRQALLEHGLSCTCLQPQRARAFARGLGALEKTDKLDARLLARMATLKTQHPEVLRSPAHVQLVELMDFRGQLREDLSRIQTQVKKQDNALVTALQDERQAALQAHLEQVEASIQELVEQDEELHEKSERMCQLKGVSQITAWSLLAYLPELGEVNGKEIAKLAGLAPMAQESGKYEGKRRCGAGRGRVKKALWMASLSVAQYEPSFKEHYERLKNKHKPKSVARIANCRKLLCVLNAMLAKKEDYAPEKVRPHQSSKNRSASTPSTNLSGA